MPDKYCSAQLSARKLVPWMLTTLIHTLPTAYFCLTERVIVQRCIEKYREELVEYDPEEFLPESCFERRLRPDLSCWVVGCLVILAPQVVVLVAVVRVARFNPNKAAGLCPSLPLNISLENYAISSGWRKRMSLILFHLPRHQPLHNLIPQDHNRLTFRNFHLHKTICRFPTLWPFVGSSAAIVPLLSVKLNKYLQFSNILEQ